MSTFIIGISAFFHDSAAALIQDGRVVAAAQEERFTRIKNDSSFPVKSIEFLLEHCNLDPKDISEIVFYDKPWLKFERILESSIRFAPFSLKNYLRSLPVWLSEKFNMRKLISKELSKISKEFECFDIKFSEHHFSHAASSFYTSPFKDCCSVTIDGVGEWATLSIHDFNTESHELIKEMHYPDSVGLLYSAFTYYCGFMVNSGEYKLMGLAPYGVETSERTQEFIKKIQENLFQQNDDGSIKINLDFFSYHLGDKMINDKAFSKLFNLPRRNPDHEITQDHCDFALAAQITTEQIIIRVIKHAKEITKSENLCLSGGVALNCVANNKIKSLGLFKNIWIHPSPGDAGGAIGSALGLYFQKNKYTPSKMAFSPYLGPSFQDNQVYKCLVRNKIPFTESNEEKIFDLIAKELHGGKIIGWFQGQMEWGPRALGNRSILADATKISMQKNLNLKIKKREGFRPFAPVVLEEFAAKYFDLSSPSPLMQYTTTVLNSKITSTNSLKFYERLTQIDSPIPAVTHLDLSARVQTVNKSDNLALHKLITSYYALSKVPVLINTSFNVRGEPIVCTPQDALDCFLSTDIDILVINNFIIEKSSIAQNRLGIERTFSPD